MAIEKALYAAPQGIEELDALNKSGPEIEIEIEDPEAVHIGIDGQELLSIEEGEDDDFNKNLAEEIDESVLQQIASDLIGDFDDDISSRKDWIQTYTDGLELLGMKIEERAEPWEGACGVYHPLLSEALVKFQAETMLSTFPAAGPVKTQIIGKETPEKKDAAQRVQDDMNYQLLDVMQEYRPEHERMLWGLGLAGNAFKKVYYDPQLGRQVSLFVPAEDLVVPYGASVGQKISINGTISTYSLIGSRFYYGGILAPNGEIHFISDGVIQKISTNLVLSTYSVPSNTNFYGAILTSDGIVHMVPSTSPRGQKLNFQSAVNFSPALCQSPYFNKL